MDAEAEVAQALLALVHDAPGGQIPGAQLCSKLYLQRPDAKKILHAHQGLRGFIEGSELNGRVCFVADQVCEYACKAHKLLYGLLLPCKTRFGGGKKSASRRRWLTCVPAQGGGKIAIRNQRAELDAPDAGQATSLKNGSSKFCGSCWACCYKAKVPTITCRFRLACTRKDCFYAHASPSGTYNMRSSMQMACQFGIQCNSSKCGYAHPSKSLACAAEDLGKDIVRRRRRRSMSLAVAFWQRTVQLATLMVDLRKEILQRRRRRSMSLAVAFWQHTVHRNKLRRQLATTSAHKALERLWCSWLKSVSEAREVASLMVEVTGLLNEVSVIQIKV